MTKTVFPNSMVAHVWAQQNQDHGKSGNGNFSFRGTDLFSYSTVIARFVKDVRGNNVVLITDHKYSVTTSQHKGEAWAATRQYVQFEVPSLGYYGDDVNHETNLTYLAKLYTDMLAGFRRKRELPESSYWSPKERLQELADKVRSYCDHFGLTAPTIDVEHDYSELVAFHAERDAKRNTPQAIAKRERERQRRVNKIRDDYINLKGDFGPNSLISYKRRRSIESLMSDADKAARRANLQIYYAAEVERLRPAFRAGEWIYLTDDSFTDEDIAIRRTTLVEKHRTEFRAGGYHYNYLHDGDFTDDDRAARRAAILAHNAERITKWRNGEHVYLDYNLDTILRVSGSEIETSRGASFPLEHGKRAFALIKKCHDEQRAFRPNGHAIHLGHFTVDEVTVDGDVRAGCHYVKWSEIEAIARQLELL
jgi:hypothetical protein